MKWLPILLLASSAVLVMIAFRRSLDPPPVKTPYSRVVHADGSVVHVGTLPNPDYGRFRLTQLIMYAAAAILLTAGGVSWRYCRRRAEPGPPHVPETLV